MDSWTERSQIRFAASNKVSRHVILSTAEGVITELELLGASSGDAYMVRSRHVSSGIGRIIDSASWIGFRYHDAHWSFVKP